MISQRLTLKQLLYQAHKKKGIINAHGVRTIKIIANTLNNDDLLIDILSSYRMDVTKSIFHPGEFYINWENDEKKQIKCKSIW